ncbi:proteasome inhibitor PI31 subunit-like isoform X2 [Sitodiplosis mosellana]|uniref:proteasome inhibitor PI31 subunit-like isoform X2 n=1 Tax=Sitodiplosis mosellana TaxID=263140 RepID=UPI00244405CF|nr:proteasome inhibitor PI31 subunit-like isoform X2 [Sitodiplosis mosellana]
MSAAYWKLLYSIIENDIKCKADIIIAIAHWLLVDRANLECLGLGEEKTLRANEVSNGNVKLPNNWNENSFDYSLRYVLDGKVYVLHGMVPVDESKLTLSFSTTEEEPVVLDVDLNHVRQLRGSLPTLVPDWKTVFSILRGFHSIAPAQNRRTDVRNEVTHYSRDSFSG